MQTPSPEQKLEIARRVHETFDRPKRWHPGRVGPRRRRRRHRVRRRLPRRRQRRGPPPSPRSASPCRRAPAASASVQPSASTPAPCSWAILSIPAKPPKPCAPSTPGSPASTPAPREQDAADFEPHLNSLIEWNDSDERSYRDIRELTARRTPPPRRAALVIPGLRRPRPSPLRPSVPRPVRRPGRSPASRSRAAGAAAREFPPRAGRPCPSSPETAMLHRITGRAVKCGPAAISAIAGMPTHEAAAVIRRLFDPALGQRRLHRRTRRRARGARLGARLRAAPSEVAASAATRAARRSGTASSRTSRSRCARSRSGPSSTPRPPALGRFRRAIISWRMPTASSPIPAPGSRASPAFWFRANPDHDRVALRRVREAVPVRAGLP